MDEYRHKVITDPVHGTIGLSEIERRVVDSPSFQRLRRLKQLSLAHLVYPTADHSRFAHSLGVFHVMGRAIDTLIHKGRLEAEEKQKLRLAALLHDVGHYPYSHLVETIDADGLRASWLGSGGGSPPVPFPSHEELGRLVVTTRSDITDALGGRFDPVEIADIFCGEHSNPIYNALIHSSLDLDRMDYLTRDAIATGVPFGKIDLEYLLSHLDVDADGRLGIEPRATTAAEHFMLARYFMSRVIYQHKTVFAFEALARQIVYLLRKADKLWRDGDSIRALVADDRGWLEFHDSCIDRLIEEHANDGGTLGMLCRTLVRRHPPVRLAEFCTLTREGRLPEHVSAFRARRERELPGLADRFGIPIECFLWEDPRGVALEDVGPFVGIGEAAGEDALSELLRVVNPDGTSRPLISDEHSIVHWLSQLRFRVTRLYVVETDPAKIGELKAEVASWARPA